MENYGGRGGHVCSTVTGLSDGNPTVYGLDKYGEVEE